MKTIIIIFCYFFVSSQIIAQVQNSNDTIYWSPCYKLKWEDFKGKLDSASEFDAISSITIDYNITQQTLGKITSVKVFCFFNKIKSKIKSYDSTLLNHEQVHFNIAELFTRKLRKEFQNKFQNKNALSLNEAESIYSAIKKDYDEMNILYDNETDYSKNKVLQKKWTQKISKELLSLRLYQE
jgi:hypothetical protein